MDFHEIRYWSIFLKSLKKIQVSLHLEHKKIFENDYLQARRFNRDNTWMRYVVAGFFSGLISRFVFDVLQIPSA
jgi:hypothetical protein